jgi:hypothetical protein
MPMPRKPSPPKRQVLIRLFETSAEFLEAKAEAKGYPSLPAYLTDRIERQVAADMRNASKNEVEPRFKGKKK